MAALIDADNPAVAAGNISATAGTNVENHHAGLAPFGDALFDS